VSSVLFRVTGAGEKAMIGSPPASGAANDFFIVGWFLAIYRVFGRFAEEIQGLTS